MSSIRHSWCITLSLLRSSLLLVGQADAAIRTDFADNYVTLGKLIDKMHQCLQSGEKLQPDLGLDYGLFFKQV